MFDDVSLNEVNESAPGQTNWPISLERKRKSVSSAICILLFASDRCLLLIVQNGSVEMVGCIVFASLI